MKIELGIKDYKNFEEFQKRYKEIVPRKTVYNQKITMVIAPHRGGYQLFFESKKGTISAICYLLSDGSDKGLWEIL